MQVTVIDDYGDEMANLELNEADSEFILDMLEVIERRRINPADLLKLVKGVDLDKFNAAIAELVQQEEETKKPLGP